MAPMRIRHKLLVGLGLVVGVVALLLAGSMQGLTAYNATVKTADSKLAELDLAEEFKRRIAALTAPADAGSDEAETLRTRTKQCHESLSAYLARLEDTVARHRDPDNGERERLLVGDIQAAFKQFADARVKAQTRVLGEGESRLIVDQPDVQAALQRLGRLANELRLAIYDDLYQQIAASKQQHRRSVAVVVGTSVIAVVSMVALVVLFLRWVFQPLTLLQAGVARVAGGDFEHRIHLDTADEMQDLAAAFNDMTARLQTLYGDLNKQVSDRGNQLVRSERLASVGFLAAGVAHEINNPLASIAFCGEALERRLSGLVAHFPEEREGVTKYLKMIQQEAFRCKTITQNLLEFSRVGEGDRQPTDLVDVVQGTLEMAQHLRTGHGKRVVFRPAGRLVATVNPQEIKQVVLNLVVNALDSMDAGGTLTIALAATDDRAEMVFADTGCGMPADVLDRIFEPFFTKSRTGKGTGLGLSICQRIVAGHHGEIEASSPGPQHGSTFVVRLPLAAAARVPQESRHAAAA